MFNWAHEQIFVCVMRPPSKCAAPFRAKMETLERPVVDGRMDDVCECRRSWWRCYMTTGQVVTEMVRRTCCIATTHLSDDDRRLDTAVCWLVACLTPTNHTSPSTSAARQWRSQARWNPTIHVACTRHSL